MVLMAIMLDRFTTAVAEQSGPTGRRSRFALDPRIRRWVIWGSCAVTAVVVYLSNTRLKWSVFPKSDLGSRVADWVNSAVNWIVDTFDWLTNWIYETVTNYLLNPLQDLIANTPWWLTSLAILSFAVLMGTAGKGRPSKLVVPGLLGVAAVMAAGLWAAGSITMAWQLWWGGVVILLVVSSLMGCGGALQPVSVGLVVIFGIGLWNDSMITLSMTLVATALVMVFGVIVGVWIGRSRRADTALRPVLDALQTMPSLVYIIPAFALFAPSRFLAIAAAALYAIPVSTKIVADGIRNVAPTTVEASESAGSSRWQVITKVQLPMSKGSLVLAANQGLLFVLSMVVIGGLVGGGSLGYLVVSGFSQTTLFGKGFAAAIAITALGIMLDRITVHAAARYGRAETD
jgi:glycine betaine/proline transport system permease protein